ncbi:MAG: MFS transporter [Calditrichaceae bacterium]|nr:MFS transporter [Calditrichaceae bacterium]MBN2710694.1 MFS transporter [Calditrichaceae bacterium]
MTVLTSENIKSGLRASIIEGGFAHFHANLTGTIFLPAFALLLGADNIQIGILASLPFFTTVIQFFGSYLVQKTGNCKKIAILSAALSRSLWLIIIILIFILYDENIILLLELLIIIVMLHHSLAAVSGVSWMSWMSGLVPPEIRGRFFGLRNSVLGIAAMLVTISGGYFIDWFTETFPVQPEIYAFQILFFIAFNSGMISVFVLLRQPRVTNNKNIQTGYLESLRIINRNNNFKKLLRFGVIWQFAVNFASPFFVIYLIKDLQLSYTIISLYAIMSALADLSGMGFWGLIADQLGNKPIILITACVSSIMPVLWLFTETSDFCVIMMLPLLHFIGGFVFSGSNLCSMNLVYSMAPKQNNSNFFAVWSAFTGIAAGTGAIVAGWFSTHIEIIQNLLPFRLENGLFIIFFCSSIFRSISVLFLKNIREDKSIPVIKAVRVLRSIRFWATTMGYHPLLQFFISSNDNKNTVQDYWPLWKAIDLLPSRFRTNKNR